MAALVLASGSPRRLELLKQFQGHELRVVIPQTDECCSLPAGQAVGELSRRKAMCVETYPGEVAIAADTLVELNGHTLGKPANEAEAQMMLEKLSGHWHDVYTGITVFNGQRMLTETERTRVRFAPLSIHDIKSYIASGEPLDKAGSYGIQGRGALFVSAIEGDFYNVMGLPLFRLGQLLNKFGIKL
ncbi:MAG: Maf family protein [Oscillospiraceae bacterium]|nr:Maf family protein [Oscillospiraceae bacterium]